MWDERYSVDEYVYGPEPNGFLASMTARLKKGRVLCLAEGEGRNAVHLAREGFTVTAVSRGQALINSPESRWAFLGICRSIPRAMGEVSSSRSMMWASNP